MQFFIGKADVSSRNANFISPVLDDFFSRLKYGVLYTACGAITSIINQLALQTMTGVIEYAAVSYNTNLRNPSHDLLRKYMLSRVVFVIENLIVGLSDDALSVSAATTTGCFRGGSHCSRLQFCRPTGSPREVAVCTGDPELLSLFTSMQDASSDKAIVIMILFIRGKSTYASGLYFASLLFQ